MLVKDLLIESGADIGLFGVKLWVRGRWRTLVLDDRFPCIHNAATDCWEPVFTGRAVGREFELVSVMPIDLDPCSLCPARLLTILRCDACLPVAVATPL